MFLKFIFFYLHRSLHIAFALIGMHNPFIYLIAVVASKNMTYCEKNNTEQPSPSTIFSREMRSLNAILVHITNSRVFHTLNNHSYIKILLPSWISFYFLYFLHFVASLLFLLALQISYFIADFMRYNHFITQFKAKEKSFNFIMQYFRPINNFIIWSLARHLLPHLSTEYRNLMENFDHAIYG